MEHEFTFCVLDAVCSVVMSETLVSGWHRKICWKLAQVCFKSMSFT